MNSQIRAFEKRWRAEWGDDAAPIGWHMRALDSGADRWRRFHTLPKSKQYPESPEEMQTVLDRYVTLLTEVAGDSAAPLLVIAQEWDQDDLARTPWIEALLPDAVHWRSSVHDEDLYDLPALTISFGPHRPEELEPLFRAVSNEEAHVAVTDATASWLFAPYDGGVDVFLKDERQQEDLRARFSDWLPAPGLPGSPLDSN
ncbi:hypothetical protein [Rathayibacter sp. AY1B5]|uniref:DUF3885 domain-containing protein n=1 Tax=Rathayibacter sp. AY1B5 TaxID=2080530 RepID=UPI0011B07441|nr:hypothetical protein [Rathayibacter sp. AY1B5]